MSVSDIKDEALPQAEAVKRLQQFGLRIEASFKLPSSMRSERPTSLPKITIVRNLDIGAYSYLGSGCDIRSATIGRVCSLGRRSVMAPAEHPLDCVTTHPVAFNPRTAFADDAYFADIARLRPVDIAEEVTVGHDVWIGEGAFIRSGVSIGTGAVIAARAVVVKDVAPYSIVAGVPAKHIRYRLQESLIERMLASEWWNLDLRGYGDLMGKPAELLDAIESGRFARLPMKSISCVRTKSGDFSVTEHDQ